MKKVVLFFAVCGAIALSSCGGSSKVDAPAADSTAAVADSAAPADSAVADSAAAPADSAAAAQ